MSSCEYTDCDREFFFRYSCNYCGGSYCPSHRLPENHDCPHVSRPSSFGEVLSKPDVEKIRTSGEDGKGSVLSLILTLLIYPIYLVYWILKLLFSAGISVLMLPLTLLNFTSAKLPGSSRSQAITIVLTVGLVAAGSIYFAPEDLDQSEIERDIHHEINDVRIDKGIHELQWAGELHSVAKNHSEDMDRRGYYNHTSPDGETMKDRYLQEGLGCVNGGGAGEAIHKLPIREQFRTHDGDLDTLMDGEDITDYVVESWLNSPGHRKILLSEGASVQGIGVDIDESADQILITLNQC